MENVKSTYTLGVTNVASCANLGLRHRDPNAMSELESELSQTHATQTLPNLPPEVIRHHLVPALSLSVLRNFRRVSKAARDDASAFAIHAIKRAPGTHPLHRHLGARFPNIARLNLSGDSQLVGDATLKQALASASQLTSLSLAGCSSLSASFVKNSLVQACPRLQHLALSCCCAADPDTEAAVMAALAAAPLAQTLLSLDLHCGGAFQPELRHLDGVGQQLTSLRVYGNRTMDDAALADLPRVTPALVELHLSEQQSRRGRHIRGEGLAALQALAGLRALALQCPEPDPRSMAAALATLTQLTVLDLSRCEPRLVEALAPLEALVNGEGALRRLSLPTAYTSRQLERGLPAVLGGAGGGSQSAGQGTEAARESGAAPATAAAPALQALRMQTSAGLPEAIVVAMSCLVGLQELNLSYCGPAGSGTAMAGVAALSGLTAVRLVQEYGDGDGSGRCSVSADGSDEDHGVGSNKNTDGDPRVSEESSGLRAEGVITWYDALPKWRRLRQLELTYAEGLDDSHLDEMGRSLRALSYFSLSRNTRATGAGFASWTEGCRGLTVLTLYDCSRVDDAALSHVAALPLRSLTLAHLPEVGAPGVQHLARVCTTLRSLTVERLARPPGAALAALWRLPLLETLCLRMCAVNNQTLEIALQSAEQHLEQTGPSTYASSAAAPDMSSESAPEAATPATGAAQAPLQGSKASAADGDVRAAADAAGGGSTAPDGTSARSAVTTAPAQHLTWLELQGALVSTSGLWALRHAPGLTHLDLSYCASVADGVADVLLHGGGRAPGAAGAAAAAAAAPPGGVSSGAGVGVAMLIPSLVHIDLRGCMVAESTLERLRVAGLAVNQGASTWR